MVAGSALSSIASAITLFFEEGEKSVDRNEAVQLLANALMLLGDLLHHNNTARRAFITPTYDKRLKEVLKSTDSGNLLF